MKPELETAGVLDLLSGVTEALKKGISAAKNAIDVGSGQSDANLGDALRQKEKDEEDPRKNIASRKQLDRAKKKIRAYINHLYSHVKKAVKKHGDAHDKKHRNKKPDAKSSGKPVKPVSKKANKDIKIKGKLDGKASTKTIRKGAEYKVAKDKRNRVTVMTRGQRGQFVVAPSDTGKL